MHSYFPSSQHQDASTQGKAAGHGLKRLKQTHASAFGWWDMTSCFFQTIFSYVFITLTCSPGASALRNDFLPAEDEGTFLDRTAVWCLTSVCKSLFLGAGCWSFPRQIPSQREMREISGWLKQKELICYQAIKKQNQGLNAFHNFRVKLSSKPSIFPQCSVNIKI